MRSKPWGGMKKKGTKKKTSIRKGGKERLGATRNRRGGEEVAESTLSSGGNDVGAPP